MSIKNKDQRKEKQEKNKDMSYKHFQSQVQGHA